MKKIGLPMGICFALSIAGAVTSAAQSDLGDLVLKQVTFTLPQLYVGDTFEFIVYAEIEDPLEWSPELLQFTWSGSIPFGEIHATSGHSAYDTLAVTFSETGSPEIEACVLDTAGRSECVQWHPAILNSFPPELLSYRPTADISVAMDQLQEFEVEVADFGCDLTRIEWLFDGVVQQTSTPEPCGETTRWQHEFSEFGPHEVKVRAWDAPGDVVSHSWAVEIPLGDLIMHEITFPGTLSVGDSYLFIVHAEIEWPYGWEPELDYFEWSAPPPYGAVHYVSGYSTFDSLLVTFDEPGGSQEVTTCIHDRSGRSECRGWSVSVINEYPPEFLSVLPAETEVRAAQGQTIAFEAQVVDFYDDLVLIEWLLDETVVETFVPQSGEEFVSWAHQFPELGSHVVGIRATDQFGDLALHTWTVVVEPTPDTSPPAIVLTTGPTVLWPPNHKYRTYLITDIVASATDDRDGDVTDRVVIARVTSDEPVHGKGDGNTVNDMLIADCNTVILRAERAGSGNGRAYTVQVAVADEAGNVGSAEYVVMVPTQHGRIAVVDSPLEQIESNCLVESSVNSGKQTGTLDVAECVDPSCAEWITAYPNPFHSSTVIRYELPTAASDLDLSVYDLLGRKVTTLASGPHAAGRHEVVFDGSDLPSGMYICVITSRIRTVTFALLLAG